MKMTKDDKKAVRELLTDPDARKEMLDALEDGVKRNDSMNKNRKRFLRKWIKTMRDAPEVESSTEIVVSPPDAPPDVPSP